VDLTPDPKLGVLWSSDICVALGINGDRLRELARRESIPVVGGLWQIDEVKRIAARLIVIGSAEERVRARETLLELAKLSKS
jgi:hypothetical protein